MTFSRLLALCLAAALWGGCSKEAPAPVAAAPTPEAPVKVRLLTDWYAQAEHGGFYQALAKGYYKEVGLDVDVIQGGPGPLVTQKIMADVADMAVGASDAIVQNVAAGLPFIIFGSYMEHDPQAILVHEDGPIQKFEDLKGRTVMGIPGSGWIPFLKARYKIDFQLIPGNYGIAQFMSDKNFAQQCFITNEPYFTAQNGVKSKGLLIANSGWDPYRIIFCTNEYARTHPDVLRKVMLATTRGWIDYMNGDPTPANKIILERNSKMTQGQIDYSRAAMRASYLVLGRPDTDERPGLMTQKRLEAQAKLLADLKIIPAAVPVEKFATLEFVPAAP